MKKLLLLLLITPLIGGCKSSINGEAEVLNQPNAEINETPKLGDIIEVLEQGNIKIDEDSKLGDILDVLEQPNGKIDEAFKRDKYRKLRKNR